MKNIKKTNKKINLSDYGEYIEKSFAKINIPFQKGKRILDIGCGDGVYCEVFSQFYGLDTYGIDIYRDKKIDDLKNVKFNIGSIYDIKFKDNYFDYVFLHDVLHHIDEEKQSYKKHKKAIEELKRVVKKDGLIIIVEANRFNFLFYPHMVLIRKHNHWRQSYFKKIMKNSFSIKEYKSRFIYFEAHVYPWGTRVWKLYEKVIESLPIKSFYAYNVFIAQKNK